MNAFLICDDIAHDPATDDITLRTTDHVVADFGGQKVNRRIYVSLLVMDPGDYSMEFTLLDPAGKVRGRSFEMHADKGRTMIRRDLPLAFDAFEEGQYWLERTWQGQTVSATAMNVRFAVKNG